MTGGARYGARSSSRENMRSFGKREIIKYISLVVVLCILAVMQTSFVKIDDHPVGLVLLFVSAVGMLFGERDGGVLGLIGGIIIDSLGGGVIYISPLVFALIGYLCGICVQRLLSSNFPSYLVYMLIVGIIKQAVNLLYFVMLSDNFNLMQIFIYTLVPNYIAFVLFSPLVYGIAYLLYKAINYKKKKKYKNQN